MKYLNVTPLKKTGKYRQWFWIIAMTVLFTANKLHAQGGCASLTPTFINYEPCKYRVQIENTSECTPSISVLIDPGEFESWSANTAGGWTGQELAPNLVQLTHTQGFVPLGTSFPIIFTLPVDLITNGNFTWEFTCGLGEGCTLFPGFELVSCPDPKDASIIGVKYRECGSLPYSNQTIIPDWTVQLLNVDGNVIGEQVTDAGGAYAFYDLPLGQYIVREAVKPGWTARVPANGQYTVDLAPSQQVTRNFGNCPGCSCDSIYVDVVQVPFVNDTCTYTFSASNSGAFCFNSFNISIASGTFASVASAPGWTAILVDSQHIQLDPPGDYLANGYNPDPCLWRITGSDNHQITVSTSWDDGGVPVSCSRAFSFQCPPPSSPPPCCPAGSQFGPELTKNGDFELGNQDFTNDYNYFNPGSPTAIGAYSVLNQTQVFPANSQWACIDHTTFTSAGQMLIVDGYGGPIAWQQTVTVTAGTNYSFYAWFNNLVIPTKNHADPQMALFVGNTQIAGPLNLPETPDQWIRLCGTWTAMASGPAVLSIQMLATTSIGNDVAIDDVSFRACNPQPCGVTISANPSPFCGSGTLTANPTGLGPFSYQWSHGQNTQTINVQGLPCGTVCSVSVTCADGSMSSASYTVSDNVPPVAVCKLGIGLDLGGACSFQVTPAFVDGGSTDNCQIQSMSVSPSVLTACTTTIVTLTVTDWCGNTSTCSMGIQTAESEPPSLICPANTTINGTVGPNGLCTAVYQPDKPPAFDNCDPAVLVTHNAPAILSSGGNSITWTATDDCGNTATCIQIVTVDCCMACPAGNIVGPELVFNGDFESGFGFGSDYVIANSCSPGIYNVVTGPQLPGICGEWGGLDHTFNTVAGNMLAVDGSQTPGLAVWREQIPILANTKYAFCAYINNLNVPNFPNQPDPIVEVWLIGSNSLPGLLASYTLSELPDVWININATWTSPNVLSPPYNLEIRTSGTSFGGNNFAVDDISFRSCSAPCTCGTYADMSYRPSVGAPNVPVDCGDLIIANCNLQNLQLGGNFMCQGPNCPSTIPMFWNLTGPSNAFVTSGTMSGPGFSVSIPTAVFALPGLYTLTLGAVCGMDTCYCSFTIETPACDPYPCACPAGSIAGTNMVTNGNFQLGNTGFTSGYLPLPPTCSPMEYTVTDGNNVGSLCNNWSCIDHTTGLLSGQFFVADGSQTIGNDAYRHPITLNQGTNYTLCAWVNNLNDTTLNAGDPIVEAWILNSSFVPIAGPIATTGPLPESPDVWVSLTTTWTSSVTGSYYLAFRTSGTSFAGNNFALDDITFRACAPGCSADFSFNSMPCSRKVNFTGFANGTGPFTYAWNFGDPGSGVNNTSTLQNPMHQFSAGGTYTVTLVITDATGCTATYTATVTVPPLLSISIAGNTSICADDCTTLTATGNFGVVNWMWSNSFGNPNITVCPQTTTTYTVTATDASGCTATASVTVNVLDCGCGPGDLLNNGTFIFGITPGNLGGPGNAPPWSPIYSPQVVTTDGCVQQGCMQMWGNQVVGEGIEQSMVIQPGCTYQITFCAKRLALNNPSGNFNPQLRFRATTGTGVVTYGSYGALGANSVLIGNSANLTTNWLPYTINWTAPSSGPALSNFVVTVWNNQAAFNPALVSWVRVDSICVFKMDCPPPIECGDFSHTGFGYEKGPFKPAICGNTSPVILQCPNTGQKLYFTGAFNCIGGTTSSAPVTWELWKNSLPTGITGSTVATPFFGIQLYPSYFPTSGVYELRIVGHCGNKLCLCTIKFEMPACPDPCSCDDLASDVAAGFYQTIWSKQCRMCFTPIGLEDCDRVEWSIEPVDSSYVNPVGYSNGKKAFCYSFASGGNKTITMRVIRLRPDGTTCEAVFHKKIFVKCNGVPDCENQVFFNPDFGTGASVGTLGSDGKSEDWVKVAGTPSVKDSSETGGDGWSMMLSGNDESFDAIRTDTSYCFEKDTGTITLSAISWSTHFPINNSTMIFVNLVRGDSFPTWPCAGDNCYEIACLQFPEDPNDWAEFQFDYDLRGLLVADDCSGAAGPTVSLRPVIYISNALHDDQGGIETYSQILIDNICLNGKGVVPTHTPKELSSIRIFPNPNAGTFSVALPQSATPGMMFRITDLTSRLVQEQKTEPGSVQQTVQAGELPAGLYFLQVVSEGKVLAVEKFVKQ